MGELRNTNARDNLISLEQRTPEERRKIAIMGNKASVESRRHRRLMRDVLEDKLDIKDAEGLTNQERVILGLIKGAIDGKAENFKAILETLGELGINETNGTPAVSINIIDNSALEKVMFEDEGKEE
jgi:hypothetical protein